MHHECALQCPVRKEQFFRYADKPRSFLVSYESVVVLIETGNGYFFKAVP